MENIDRLSMLKKLSFIGEENINIFSSYIPDHYDEIYTLYDLLKNTSLNFKNIDFLKPIENSKSFVFICIFPDGYFDLLNCKLIEMNNTITCMRNKPFKITINENNNKVHIKFKKI